MKKSIRLLATILIVVLVCGLLPIGALAAQDGPIQIRKSLSEQNADGSYTITMEAYVTGSVQISTKPVDVILVLDISGSMDDYIEVCSSNDLSSLDTIYGETEGWYVAGDRHRAVRYHDGVWQYFRNNNWQTLPNNTTIYTTKLNSLKMAADSFVDTIASESSEDVDNRIAIVTFSNEGIIRQPLTTVFQNEQTLKNTIMSLTAGGATGADYGMAEAQDILSSVTDTDRNKIVVMFTDGEPNHQSGFDTSVANATINTSKAMKDDGVKVYTIGCFAGADTSPDGATTSASNLNRYMHYVSSNFPTATSMTNTGSAVWPSFGSYYMSGLTSNDLGSIFVTIAETVSNSDADETTVLSDTLTEYFDFSGITVDEDNTVTGVVVQTMDATGTGDTPNWGNATSPIGVTLSLNQETNTVSISGFDYAENSVVKNNRKLQVQVGHPVVDSAPS